MDTDQKSTESTQYLTFQLAGQEYALTIMKVREIVGYGALTKVPRTPAAIRGVMNLRGNVVPVIDLGLLFGIASGPITARTCIIVVETSSEGERRSMGIIADAVNKVAQWSSEDVLPPPAFGMRVPVDFIEGMARAAKQFVILLDIEKVLSNAGLDASVALREL
jgi:purine-binding chemotaxis protein CheW